MPTRAKPFRRHQAEAAASTAAPVKRKPKKYGHRWRLERRAYLANHPYCEECLKVDRTQLAQCVDHIIPHRGNDRLFWDRANWQSLCNCCHSKKTAKGQ